MKSIIPVLAFGLIFVTTTTNAAINFENKQYTITGNYQFNAQNPEGTNPTSTISLSASPSVIFDDVHEFGATWSYTVSKSEVTLTGAETKTSTNVISGFYRYNLTVSEPDAKIPIIAYFGPQAGITAMDAGAQSSSDMSLGAQFGFNLMFAKNLALNIHALQFDTVFAEEQQLLITQSIGVKYFF